MSVERTSAVEVARRTIREWITSGALRVGGPVPAERALTERLSASRMTLRHALKQLEAEGLLSCRPGVGYFVTDWRRQGGQALLHGGSGSATPGHTPDEAAQLLLARRHLAAALLERAEGLTVDAGARSAMSLAAADLLRDPDPMARARAEADLYRALVETTGAGTVGYALNPVLSAITGDRWLCEAMYADGYDLFRAWLELARWLGSPAPRPPAGWRETLAGLDAATVERRRDRFRGAA